MQSVILSFQTLSDRLIDAICPHHWAIFDELDGPSRQRCQNVLGAMFAPLTDTYTTTSVRERVNPCKTILGYSLLAALDVPFPLSPVEHILRVSANIQEIYYQVFHNLIREAVILEEHRARTIQRIWKTCVTDPTHPVCQRRLNREFTGLLETSVAG